MWSSQLVLPQSSHRKEGARDMNFLLLQPSLAFSKFSVCTFWEACVDSRHLKPTQMVSFWFSQEKNLQLQSSICLRPLGQDATLFHKAFWGCLQQIVRDAPGVETKVQHYMSFIVLCLQLLPSAVSSSHKPLPCHLLPHKTRRGKHLPGVGLWL